MGVLSQPRNVVGTSLDGKPFNFVIDDAREQTGTQHGGGVGAMEQFLVALKTMPLGSWFHRYRSDELSCETG